MLNLPNRRLSARMVSVIAGAFLLVVGSASAAPTITNLGVISGSSSRGHAINADGSTVAGDSSSGFDTRAFRWNSGTMTGLGTLGGGSSNGRGISADGSTVAGFSEVDDTVRAFRWTSGGGMQDLGTLGGTASRAFGVNADGSTVTGGARNGSGQERAFRWTSGGGMQDLGHLGGGESYAYAISGDGLSVAGASFNSGFSLSAFLYTPALGMVDLNAYLPTIGVDLTGWTLREARGLSADGSAITGYGIFGGAQRAFLITGVPAPASGGLLALGGLLAARRRR